MSSNKAEHLMPSKNMSPLPNFWLPVFIRNQFLTTIPLPTRQTYPQVQNGVAVITGSNTGLGFEASKQLLSLGLSHLVMGVRNLEKGIESARKLQAVAPEAKIDVWELDMTSYPSIKAFAKKCAAELSQLDFVILNAGLSPSKFEIVRETGHEVGVQNKTTNHSPLRITIVNSLTAHLCKFPNRDQRPLLKSFDNPNMPWNSGERYGVSKLLNQLFLVRLCEKVNADEVTINMVDPGLTSGTNLGGHRDASGVAAVFARAFFSIAGRPLDRGAASYTDAVYGHGKESHGCFLMSCKIAPLAGWFYTHGDVLVDQVWNETLEELRTAGFGDDLSGI